MARERDDNGRFKRSSAKEDQDLLCDLRDTIDTDLDAWRETREEANKDMRCVAGDPWGALDPRGLAQRREAMRPALALDELNQYLNQAINDWLLNPRAVEYDPVGNGANDQTARIYADITREIEFRSHATNADATAYRDMLQRSYGWQRIRAVRESSRSFNKVLQIDAVPNPDMIIPDCDAQLPDQSDMTRLTVARKFTHGAFRRKFPNAKIHNFGADYRDLAPGWVSEDEILLAEHWCVKSRQRTLLLLPDGTTIFEDELEDLRKAGRLGKGRPQIEDQEDVDDPYVYSYLTNGVEILERAPWPGNAIPFIACFGQILYFDTGDGVNRKLMSMTRLARDPYMLYCYYRSTEAEVVGMTPKFPYFVYEGQLSAAQLKLLADSLHQPVAVIQVKPTLDGVNPTALVPFPQRNPYEPPIGALELGAEAARRAIQAAMGISPLPTPAQRNNEKTGAAFERIESSMQKGAFHFVDHGEYMVRRRGVLLENLIEVFYDSQRTVGLIDAIGKATRVKVNVPGGLYSTKGDHVVTVKAGPSYESSRERADAFIGAMVKAPGMAQVIGPQKFAAILSMSIRLMNLGPLGDQLANIVDPQDPNNPMMVAQQNAALKQQLQQVGQALQKAMSDLNADAVKVRGRLAEKQMDGQISFTLQRMKDATAILVKKLDAVVKTGIASQQSEDERIALGVETARELRLAAEDRVHDSMENREGRRHEIHATIANHLNDLEQLMHEHRNKVDQIVAGALVAAGNGNGSDGDSAGA